MLPLMPDQPLEWLDRAAALLGLWMAAAALDRICVAATARSLAWETHVLLAVNVLLLGAIAPVLYQASDSVGLAALALGLIWRWWAGIVVWACENLEE